MHKPFIENKTRQKQKKKQKKNAEARHLTANVGSISPPRVLRSATPRASGSFPPSLKLLYSQVQGLRGGIAAHEERSQHPQNRSYFSIEGGRNRERKCRIPRISPPPPPPPLRFVLRLRLQKGGAYLRDTTVIATVSLSLSDSYIVW